MSDFAVKVTDLHKDFMLPHSKSSSLKQAAISWLKRDNYTEVQNVLRGIDFEVKKGEFIGIVGRNGSGKSTLLKILAGVYTPTQGGVEKNGTLVPFIELGVGFNPELSGRDNVYLNGALLGFSRQEMNDMYNEIVEFAELERFMDQKLKNYSSGMQVRLAFSIAIRARADILLLDEVLAVGDSEFQKKCHNYFRDVQKSDQTVILVTHSMDMVERYCDRAILIDNGEIEAAGDPQDVVAKYELSNLSGQERPSTSKKRETAESLKQLGEIKEVKVNSKEDARIKIDEEITMDFVFETYIEAHVTVGASIIKDDGTKVALFNTESDVDTVFCQANTTNTATARIKPNQLTKGFYKIDAAIYTKGKEKLMRGSNMARFSVDGTKRGRGGLVNLDLEWDLDGVAQERTGV